jgi:hypothetical protein
MHIVSDDLYGEFAAINAMHGPKIDRSELLEEVPEEMHREILMHEKGKLGLLKIEHKKYGHIDEFAGIATKMYSVLSQKNGEIKSVCKHKGVSKKAAIVYATTQEEAIVKAKEARMQESFNMQHLHYMRALRELANFDRPAAVPMAVSWNIASKLHHMTMVQQVKKGLSAKNVKVYQEWRDGESVIRPLGHPSNCAPAASSVPLAGLFERRREPDSIEESDR